MRGLVQRWRRRYWRPDRVALARLSDHAPATVITGASKGLGRALADAFAGDGNRLVLVARDRPLLEQAAAAIAARGAPVPLVVALDVTLPDAPARIRAALASQGLFVDVLVNCAGIGQAGLLAEADPQRIEALVALNVAALTRLTHAALPDMLLRGRGGIINIASLAGVLPGPGQAAYYASKAYVMSFTEAVAEECRGRGVSIAVAAPGPIDTRFHDRMGAGGAFYQHIALSMGPQSVARWVRLGYRLGMTVIIPGVRPLLVWPFARYLPHLLTAPLMKFLLLPRAKNGPHDAK